MHHARLRQRRIARSHPLRFVSDLDLARALQYEVQFVLSFMYVRRMLLAGFERIESGEQVIPARQRALAHAVRLKLGPLRCVLHKHTAQFNRSASRLFPVANE